MSTSIQERTIEELLLDGDALAQNGNITGARKHFAEAVAREPENAAALTKLGNTLVIIGQQQKDRLLLQEALQRLNEALVLAPENFVALMNAGKASKMLGEKEQAAVFF